MGSALGAEIATPKQNNVLGPRASYIPVGTDRQQIINLSKSNGRLEGNVCYENRSKTG